MPEKKKQFPLWPLCIVLIAILLLALLNPACRYVYTRNFVKSSDLQTAEFFTNDMETQGLLTSDKPIFFFGSAGTHTNASCLDLSTGNYNIYSVFDVGNALGMNTLESSQYIIAYLNNLGYDYTAPTSSDWSKYEKELKECLPLENSFPWYNGILETEHCIIVQLS